MSSAIPRIVLRSVHFVGVDCTTFYALSDGVGLDSRGGRLDAILAGNVYFSGKK